MNRQEHWEQAHKAKQPGQVSWFRPHLETSLSLIGRFAQDGSASILDVGGGASTLIDDLLARGYRNVTVMDISRTAIEHARARLGSASRQVAWLVADVTQLPLALHSYDVWHDRALFHFLTEPDQRQTYVRNVITTVRPGGHVIVGTFGPKGPTMCSGLNVVRYDAESLRAEFGPGFQLIQSVEELHQTPFGTTQQFQYCCFRVE